MHGAFIALVPIVSAVSLSAQTPAKSNGSMSAHPSADSALALVSLLVTANRDEVAAGRLAVSKAKRADVKAFGQRMVDEHTAALAKLGDQATTGGWMIPDSSAMSGMVGSSDMSRMHGKGGSVAGTGGSMGGSGGMGRTGSGSTGTGTGSAGTGSAGTGSAGTGNTGSGSGSRDTATLRARAWVA